MIKRLIVEVAVMVTSFLLMLVFVTNDFVAVPLLLISMFSLLVIMGEITNV